MVAQFAGLSHSSPIYKRGIRVCTGTGIGASLSTCLQVRLVRSTGKPNSLMRVLPDRILTGELVFARRWRVRSAASPAVFSRCHRAQRGMLSSLKHITDPAVPRPIRYLIWIGSEQEKTFGPTISGLIYRHLWPDRVCMWDSKARGGFVPRFACSRR